MKLLAVDGNSIVNRAFYGIRPLSSPSGIPTNAIYGFINMVDRLKKETQPDAIAVAFDVKQPTFRHEMYDEYKAGRHASPDELRQQIALLKDLLTDFGIAVVTCPGYEADDILGTLARKCEQENWDCVVYTGDKYSFQLVSDNVTVYWPKSGPGGTQNIVYDTAKIAEEFQGLTPEQMIDLKALQGDNSDNIPGVPGIGPKTAISLISKYGSIENIYADIDALDEKDGVKNKLRAGMESAAFSKTLGTICRDAPIDVELEDLYPKEPDRAIVSEDLHALGLNRFIEQWDIDNETPDKDVNNTDDIR